MVSPALRDEITLWATVVPRDIAAVERELAGGADPGMLRDLLSELPGAAEELDALARRVKAAAQELLDTAAEAQRVADMARAAHQRLASEVARAREEARNRLAQQMRGTDAERSRETREGVDRWFSDSDRRALATKAPGAHAAYK